jgi:hypothetical protein
MKVVTGYDEYQRRQRAYRFRLDFWGPHFWTGHAARPLPWRRASARNFWIFSGLARFRPERSEMAPISRVDFFYYG